MSKKIRVSSEINNAIISALEFYKEAEKINSKIINHTIMGTWTEEREILHTLDIELLAECLINGYEIEETPEEILLKEYNNAVETSKRNMPNTYNEGYWIGFKDGIYETLKIKGEKIKGIND